MPWYQNITLLDKIKDRDIHIWYARKTIENAWSRNVLVHQIESKLYERQVLADKVSNFEHRLPAPQSELAQQTMKDPYIFDFIAFKEDMIERDIEEALVKNVTRLLWGSMVTVLLFPYLKEVLKKKRGIFQWPWFLLSCQ